MDEITFRLVAGASGSGSPVGQVMTTNTNGFLFTVPADVYSICAIVVDGGSPGLTGNSTQLGRGGFGGNLRWKNHIPVVPGEGLLLNPQNNTGTTITNRSLIVRTSNGATVLTGSSTLGVDGVGGGDGGTPGNGLNNVRGAGGGAGGYSGNGGNGQPNASTALANGAGGSGAGGQQNATSVDQRRGGGVGVHGQGTNGVAPSGAGSIGPENTSPREFGYGGAGGEANVAGTAGGIGVVRIIWGDNRAFPSLNTHDM